MSVSNCFAGFASVILAINLQITGLIRNTIIGEPRLLIVGFSLSRNCDRRHCQPLSTILLEYVCTLRNAQNSSHCDSHHVFDFALKMRSVLEVHPASPPACTTRCRPFPTACLKPPFPSLSTHMRVQPH